MTLASVTPTLGPKGRPLLDPESMLLVDDHDSERAKVDLIGEQGVRPDQEVQRTLGQPGVDGGSLASGGLAGEHSRPQRASTFEGGGIGNRESIDQADDLGPVLFGQNLGRCHQGSLMSAFCGHQH